MRCRNITYVHLYEEGFDLDFDMSLYLFEQLVKFYQVCFHVAGTRSARISARATC